ncbi:MAG: carboxymuconolactone decarboxylase family protein [Alphaproteobacteria bacterium]|nr:carboxymuconolactone decarboxylase family protein [Candidatus Odyssella sp.]
MAQLRNLPDHATVFDVFSAYPEMFGHIADFSQAAFRGPGPLPPRDRELIFSYVSQLNACEYCFGGHAETTKLLGAAPDVFEKLKIGIDTAPVDAKLKPLLRYAKKLTETPARITPADAEACYAAGWSDEAIMQAIAMTCLANFMNRLVEGSGVHADPSKFAMRAKAAVEKGYQRPFREKMAALGKPVG